MNVRSALAAVALSAVCGLSLVAQSPKITKIDPPNWWVNMPAPMLLVNGENLTGAQFHVGKLPIARTVISQNGHWAELWLASDATNSGDVTITAETQQGKTSAPFLFEKRKARVMVLQASHRAT